MVQNLKLRSVHDVLTNRESLSDPVGVTDLTVEFSLPLSGYKKPTGKRNPPLNPLANPAPNLRLVSVHDALTNREKNSDPTDTNK